MAYRQTTAVATMFQGRANMMSVNYAMEVLFKSFLEFPPADRTGADEPPISMTLNPMEAKI
jgi:hypothetical protein